MNRTAKFKQPSRYAIERMALRNKPRKVLNMEERVQVIRLYEHKPVYQRVASVFKCSWEQIKKVIANRESILKYYVSCHTINETDTRRIVRRKKIKFLGNVMYEFVTRVRYYDNDILNDNLIQERAHHFAQIIQINDFYPNSVWLADFKKAYRVDIGRENCFTFYRVPKSSLVPDDILRHCKEDLKLLSQMAGNTAASCGDKKNCADGDGNDNAEGECDSDISSTYRDDFVIAESDFSDVSDIEEGPTIDFGNYCDTEEEEQLPGRTMNSVSMAGSECPKPTPITEVPNLIQVMGIDNFMARSGSPKHSPPAEVSNLIQHVAIDNFMAAGAYLKPLEVFALSSEDFRAIQLLSELAEHYAKSAKSHSARK